MRDKVVFASVNSQMLSALAASDPLTSAVPEAIVAVTLNVFGSIRDQRSIAACRYPETPER